MTNAVRGILSGVVLLAIMVAAALAAAPQPLNVVFVAIDDLRDVRAYDPAVQTPNLDRLARLGMRFERAYVQATFCNPSRTSFLTGLRPTRTGIFDNKTPFRKQLPDVVTLPQLFRQHGYYTYRLGKIYHGTARMDDRRSWDKAEYPSGTPPGKKGKRWEAPNRQPDWCWSLQAEGGDEDQPDGQIARLAVEFLRQPHEQPFFLAVGFHKPHNPFVAPKKYFNLYPMDQLQLHQTPPDASPTPMVQIGGPWKKAFEAFSDRDRKEFLRSYYAAATFMDAQLGKVLDCLEQTGLIKRTVVVVLSDHGYHLGERGWWNKATLYEYSARTPLLIYAPGSRGAGQPCRHIVEFVDVYPTLVDLCGLKGPADLAGRSLRPLLDDPNASWEDRALTVLRRRGMLGRTVRTDRWRLVQWGDNEDLELFDHTADPGEWHNLAHLPQYRDTIARLRKLLKL